MLVVFSNFGLFVLNTYSTWGEPPNRWPDVKNTHFAIFPIVDWLEWFLNRPNMHFIDGTYASILYQLLLK